MFISQLSNGFIAKDLLRLMEEKPHIYTSDSRHGLYALKKEALYLSTKYVPSLKGMYHQAKLTGICISSGWLSDNHSLPDETSVLQNLLMLANRVNVSDFHQLNLDNKSIRQIMEHCLIKGFENGIRLGQKIATKHQQSQTQTPMTTSLLHTYLLELTPPCPQQKRIARHKTGKRRGRQSRLLVKQLVLC